MTLPILSLFSGAGGLDLGFHDAGFRSLLAIDSFQAAINSYNAHFGDGIAVRRNLMKIKPEQLERELNSRHPGITPVGIIGGPPCQGFSIGNVQSQKNDPRNLLPLRYASIIKHFNRKDDLHFFVFENVPGLKRRKHTSRLSLIKERLSIAGFKIYEANINAADFGVPQKRKRLFFVGINETLYPKMEFIFPSGLSPKRNVKSAIGHLPEATFVSRRKGTQAINPHHPNHWTMFPKSDKFKEGKFSRSGRSFKKLDWNEPSPTVAYGNREIHIHPSGRRRLTILEAMLLQGFPESFRLTGTLSDQVEQVCNAVPPPVALRIAEAIKAQLFKAAKKRHLAAAS